MAINEDDRNGAHSADSSRTLDQSGNALTDSASARSSPHIGAQDIVQSDESAISQEPARAALLEDVTETTSGNKNDVDNKVENGPTDQKETDTISYTADDVPSQDSITNQDDPEPTATDSSANSRATSKRATRMAVLSTLSDEEYLKIKKKEVDAAKRLLRRKEEKDRVVIFELFVPDSETLDVGYQMVFDFETHLINKAEYPLILVWKRFVHSQIDNCSSVGYFGDSSGVLIESLAPLTGYLMIPFQPHTEGMILEELTKVIQKIISFDRVPGMRGTLKTLLAGIWDVISPLLQDSSSSMAADRFLKYLTATTVAMKQGKQCHHLMALIVDDNMLNVLRRFMLITMRLLHTQYMSRLETLITDSKLVQDGKIPVTLKRLWQHLKTEFKSIEKTMDDTLSQSELISARQFNDFLVCVINDFDSSLSRLDSVLSIGQAICEWRRMKNHGTIAISAGDIVSDSWEIGQMLNALSYEDDCILRERVHHDRVRGYYYKSFIPSRSLEDDIADGITTKTKNRRERKSKKRKCNATTNAT